MRRYLVHGLPALVLLAGALISAACSSSSPTETSTEPEPGSETAGLGSLEQNAIYAMGLSFAQEMERLGYSDSQVEIVEQAILDSAATGFVQIPDAPEDLETDADREAWAKGLQFANNAIRLELSEEEAGFMISAIDDRRAGNQKIEYEQYRWLIPRLANRRTAQRQERFEKASQDYLVEAAAKPGVIVTDSGMIYEEIRAGSGASPTEEDNVRVHYRGTLVDGTEFDSSYKNNAPASFGLMRVIPCFRQGLMMMKVGGQARIVCPSEIAYSNVGSGNNIPPNATLIFELDLIDVY